MRKGKAAGVRGSGSNNRFLPNSLRIISSCLKTVSANATTVASSVKSAGASVVASISAASDDHKEQVTWAGFDKLELSSSVCKHVLLLGYQNGFQVLDVDDASNFRELVSKRDDGPVAFLQMQPIPLRSTKHEGFRKSFPVLLVVGGDAVNCSINIKSWGHLSGLDNDKYPDSHAGNSVSCPRTVRFYSLSSQCYVHVLRFRSTVCMVRCSPNVVAVGLATQVYCFDATTLENKFSVLTYPVPQLGGQGRSGVNIGYGPMALGPRWLAYASNDPILVKTGRLSPHTLSPSGVASPSTSSVGGTGLVTHYAMESGKQLAAGIANLGGRGYKTLSKYCQELCPDGPNTSMHMNSGSRTGSEKDNAGVVVVKDFISRTVICQFRAHSTPISALCFDPSGTLLVTASVYGNTINIFRIMPSSSDCGSDSQGSDWSSYVHLYKFHRGIRAAVILDICFSRYSQWVAVVSSKGTCHVFVLSPFGGGVGFQNLTSSGEEPSFVPVLTLPWWSTSSMAANQQSIFPPSLVTLSVVSRIKDGNSGLLNSVSNAASSVSGKVSVPSGALAAVFHNSIPCGLQQAQTTVKSLEHLLVYTPSGHVVQFQIQPSLGVDSEDESRHHSVSFMQSQGVELSINIHPVQWWDVCRRSHWPEKEDFVSDTLVNRREASAVSDYLISATNGAYLPKRCTSDARSNPLMMDLSMSQESSHWYLANAEVHYNRGRLPIWQNSKIAFFMTGPLWVDDANGEYEVEKLSVSHVEIRQKELLPVFDHFHSIRSAFSDRGISPGRDSNAFSLEPSQAKDKASEETIICHSKPASFSSTESSDGGSSKRIENLLDFDHLNSDQTYMPYYQNYNEHSHERRAYVGVDKFEPRTNFPTVGASATEGAVPSKISCQNQFLGLDHLNNGAGQANGVGNISTEVHESFGTGLLVDKTLCKMLGPELGRKEIVAASSALASQGMDSGKENSDQTEENFLRSMSAFVEVDGEKGPKKAQEVTDAASNCASSSSSSRNVNLNQEEQDILRSMSAFVEVDGKKGPTEAQEVTDTAINHAPSSNSSRTVNSNKEEQDILSSMSAFVEGKRGPTEAQEVTDATINHELSSNNSRKVNSSTEEQDILRPMSAFVEVQGKRGGTEAQELTDAASNCAPSLNGTGNINLNQEDVLGGLFDFSGGSGEQLQPAWDVMAPEAVVKAVVSNSSNSRNGEDNQEEEDRMIGVLSCLVEGGDEMLEPAWCPREADTKSIAAVGGNVCLRKDDNQEEEMPGGVFVVSEEGPEALEQPGGPRATGTANISVADCDTNAEKDGLCQEEEKILQGRFGLLEEATEARQPAGGL